MEEKFIELDVSKIRQVPSDTEIPVHDNYGHTERALCTEFPQNKEILTKLEAVFNPEHVTECTSDLFKNDYETIVKIDDLKKVLSELLIRFDTNPQNYTKKDYSYLMGVIYKALLHLYEINPLSVIINDWSDTPREDRVPSEKLVAEKIEEEVEKINGDIFDTNTKLNQEIENRESEISRIDESISDINDLIPSEATSSNQLADKQFVNDQIATNASNFRGDWVNWTSVPSDPWYYPEDYTGNKKPNNNDYLIIQNATDYDPSNTGIWRFVYKGNWDTLGKSGWEPQYRVEQAFTQEQLNAINSGITSQKVTNYDNYRQEIDDLFPLIAAGL